MKKTKKSRFTKTDVNKICELQRTIDTYENYIMGMYGLVTSKNVKIGVVLRDTVLDDFVNGTFIEFRKLQEEHDKYRGILNQLEQFNREMYDSGQWGAQVWQLLHDKLKEFKKEELWQ